MVSEGHRRRLTRAGDIKLRTQIHSGFKYTYFGVSVFAGGATMRLDYNNKLCV